MKRNDRKEENIYWEVNNFYKWMGMTSFYNFLNVVLSDVIGTNE